MATLFHYCSAETFKSIVETSTIRLSSLLQSNDTTEGRLATAAMLRLATSDSLDEIAARRIQQDLELLITMYDGLGFCMSEEGDLLSQWRGYGDDGRGFSIGFDTEYLQKLCNFTGIDKRGQSYLAQVEYTAKRHDSLMRPFYERARERLRGTDWRPLIPGTMTHAVNFENPDHQKRSFESNFEIGTALAASLNWLFLLKSKAFSEEREWRLLSHTSSSSIGGHGIRATRDQLVLFRELELKSLGVEPVVKVYLGPKNRTPPSLVKKFLQFRALSGVQVEPSAATYR